MSIRKKISALVLSLIIVFSSLCPAALEASQERKVVRVGWYESSYNTIDERGYRSGYAYEYQLKLSAYNGWTYEYVEGSWPELLHKLQTGEIDLMSDVSHTEEREEYMYFSTLPMGSEEYYLFVAPGYDQISSFDKTTLNGKKVGLSADTYQAQLYLEWAENNDIGSENIYLETTEQESLEMLKSGQIDAYVTVDSFLDPTVAVPVYKIGSSDYYFAISKNRPDLYEDLEFAMSRIQDEDRYYNVKMFEKYIRRAGANAYLSAEETSWLTEHPTIRVGYQDNYLAFCEIDKQTGELNGVLKDYLQIASDSISNVHLNFEATGYSTAEAAMDALLAEEIDCVFPANFSGYEAEMQGIVMTPPLMNTEMYAVVRLNDPRIFDREGEVIIAINQGNPNYESFLAKHFPNWKKTYYPDSEKCLQAIAKGEADCLIISNYRYNNIARLCEKLHLTTFSLGIQLDYCLAVKRGQTELYSVLAKAISMVPDSYVNAAFSHYISEEARLTLRDFIIDNLAIVIAVISAIILIILIQLLMNIRAVRKARQLISATELDDLTGLYNRKYFFQYANRMRREHPDTAFDAVVLNIEQFHSLNELHGRDLGDEVLRALGRKISEIARENNGIGGRFEADRFDIYCQPVADYQQVYESLQAVLDKTAPNANNHLRMGVMPWQKDLKPVELFDRARTACKMARGHYNRPLIIYDDSVSKTESYTQRLLNDLRHALDNQEFEIFYQPKYDIQQPSPKLVSTEALVRWKHSELGQIEPGDFIPLFERNGQISLLDNYVWAKAGQQIAAWRERYGILIPVSVNLSRVDIFDPELKNKLEKILQDNGLDHESFKLEITESAYTENADQVIQVVGDLRKQGYEVEMDDFGSGYSSLNMLSSMPIDVLKMDREFIRNIDHDKKDQQLVALILDIARNLKVPVIAEGVERETQLQLLKQLGCKLVQGYYFSRPLPAGEFETRFLRES